MLDTVTTLSFVTSTFWQNPTVTQTGVGMRYRSESIDGEMGEGVRLNDMGHF